MVSESVLNIALELIREPAVMFVDEPTSGLSSRDSENVIDLLKELSFKGKLIFVVIHQPSSDIYKMFDKMIIMDTGGYPIFNGNPIEAVIYFKTASSQVGSDRGQCPTCGNVNPEQIFNIIEARVVNEYGEFTNKRKVQPTEWNVLYKKEISIDKVADVAENPPKTLMIPSWFNQGVIFTIRDFLSKISNKQYLMINLLEAPFLAVLLALVIRYKSVNDGEYLYRHNDNIPAYILIAIVVALFMGLTVSAEEIIRDRKIKRRESFLNLSRSSYLASKLLILFTLSAVQTLTFVLIGNVILEIKGVNFMYWGVLFTVSCHANVIGLNISSAFNSAVTVYIIIPLLLIPQMILSGSIFNYDKLNSLISKREVVPLMADIMASRWGYEAIAVKQYNSNPYTKGMFEFEMARSEAKYKNIYWRPELESMIDITTQYLDHPEDSISRTLPLKLQILKDAFKHDKHLSEGFSYSKRVDGEEVQITVDPYKDKLDEMFNPETYTKETAQQLRKDVEYLKPVYTKQLIAATDSIDNVNRNIQKELPPGLTLGHYKDKYFSERLFSIMQNESSEDKFVKERCKIIQVMDPGFQPPIQDGNPLDYRAHFYAPVKYFAGMVWDTFTFNMMIIWFMTGLLYISLYYEWLAKAITYLGNIGGKE